MALWEGRVLRLEGIERPELLFVARNPYALAYQHHDKFSSYQLTYLAGSGKTYIASKVIDSLSSGPTPEKLAYFYCNRAEEDRRQPVSILNTLIQQLAQTKSKNKLLKPVVDIYLDRGAERTEVFASKPSRKRRAPR